MSKEFKIDAEVDLHAGADDVWAALTTGTGGWLWPLEYEPREGGAAAFGGVVTAWDPPHRPASRVDGPDGWFNELDSIVRPNSDGTTHVRWVHSGVFTSDWDNQYEGATQHTDFYLHTLGEYVRHFTGLPATCVTADGSESSTAADAFEKLHRALGLTPQVTQGDAVLVNGPTTLDGVVDYLQPNFLGIRTADGLYCFLGRNAFGAPVGLGHHLFAGGIDQELTEKHWAAWLAGIYS